eukprot:gene22808-biopygen13320
MRGKNLPLPPGTPPTLVLRRPRISATFGARPGLRTTGPDRGAGNPAGMCMRCWESSCIPESAHRGVHAMLGICILGSACSSKRGARRGCPLPASTRQILETRPPSPATYTQRTAARPRGR